MNVLWAAPPSRPRFGFSSAEGPGGDGGGEGGRCSIDDEGYIITKPGSKFKVNYTRKLQHFGAYLVPMVVKGGPTNPDPAWASLYLAWGQFFTLLAFLVLLACTGFTLRRAHGVVFLALYLAFLVWAVAKEHP